MKLEDLDLLPRLYTLVDILQQRMQQSGIATGFGPNAGARSSRKQDLLFQQGRRQLPTGIWVPSDPVGRTGIITNAIPQKSPHCRHIDHDGSIGSAAADIWIMVDDHPALTKYDEGYELYGEMGRVGESIGLVWGGRFHTLHDMDHFELYDFRSLRLAPEEQADPHGTPQSAT